MRSFLVRLLFLLLIFRDRDSQSRLLGRGAWRVAWGLVALRGACMRSFLGRLLFLLLILRDRDSQSRLLGRGRLARRVGSRDIEGSMHAFVSRRAAVFY